MRALVLLVATLAAGVELRTEFPAFSKARAITSGPKDHLFAATTPSTPGARTGATPRCWRPT